MNITIWLTLLVSFAPPPPPPPPPRHTHIHTRALHDGLGFDDSDILNRYHAAREVEIPLFRSLQWLWFAAAMAWSYSASWLKAPMGLFGVRDRFKDIAASLGTDAFALQEVLSYVLYVILFVATVLSFRIGKTQSSKTFSKKQVNLRFSYQLKQLSWTVLTVAFVVIQMKCMVFTTHSALLWCIFPASMIMMNDTMAYFAGVAFGRKFIPYSFFPYLSPKKTWEGFIGGGICTIIYACCSTGIWASLPLMRCSFSEIRAAQAEYAGTDVLWSDALRPIGACRNDHIFDVPDGHSGSAGYFGGLFGFSKVQFLAMGLALFASTVAPFGGFAASATKRAFNIKDFDSVIPGHGGFMDRCDCQFIMGTAAFVVFSTFIEKPMVMMPLDRIVSAAQALAPEEQQALLDAVRGMVAGAAGAP
jgi:phosphatidate cytidylyltransferase